MMEPLKYAGYIARLGAANEAGARLFCLTLLTATLSNLI